MSKNRPPPHGNTSETFEHRDRRQRFEQARRDSLRPDDDTVALYGWHPVTAALRNPARDLRRLLATENAARRLVEEGVGDRLTPEIVRGHAIDDRLPADAVHQGLYLESAPLPPVSLDNLPAQGIVLALDQITDPHNVGAILRSAAAFAVSAVLITMRHSPSAAGVLAKAASGALEHIPLVAVQNLPRALADLSALGFDVVGLDSDGESDLATIAAAPPLVLVVGAEGKGLRNATRDACRTVARLDLPGVITSLNVSNAAALALYIASRR